MTGDLVALAERVERATGADREIDCLIWCEVGNELGFDDPPQRHRLMRPLQPRICIMGRWLGSALEKYPDDIEGTAHVWRVPSFTASLDAAMSLIDNIGVLMHLSDIGADGLPLARVGCPGLDGAPIFVGIASCIMTDTAPCAGLALALTAAALRARAQESGHG